MGQSWLSRVGPRVVARVPMGIALAAVAAVWVLGCVWSFTEQSAFAAAKGFSDPMLLPLVIDGLAAAMGGVAFAASLDARPAVGARVGTALAVSASAASNGLWAAERSGGPGGPDPATVAIGVGIPIAANLAFEVLLAELRRQVQRRRGLPAPAPLPTLRVARLLLDPGPTFRRWRQLVLEATDPAAGDATAVGSGAGSGALAAGQTGQPPEPSGPDPDGPGGLPLPAPTPTPASTGSTGSTGSTVSSGPAGAAGLSAATGSAPGTATASAVVVSTPPEAVQASEPGADIIEPVGRPPARGAGVCGDAAGDAEHPGDDGRFGGDDRITDDARADAELQLPGGGRRSSADGESARAETNQKVWRLADYIRERGQDPEALTGDEVVELGLCSSTRNGRRLKDRAVALCAALDGPVPPPRPDLQATPRLLLPGESPALALVARKQAP